MTAPLGFRIPRTYSDRPRVWIEPLEARRLLSATLGDDGVVVVRGTGGYWRIDDISIRLSVAQTADGSGPARDRVVVSYANYNGLGETAEWTFARDHIRGVRVDAGAGHCLVIVTDTTADGHIPVTLLSADGGDTLLGTRGDDRFGKELMADGGVFPARPDFGPGRDPALVYAPGGEVLGRAVITDHGTLDVSGGDGSQVIGVGDYDGAPSYGAREWIYVRFQFGNGDQYVTKLFPRGRVARVIADGAGGDDVIALSSGPNPVSVPVTFIGGPGDDYLRGIWYKSQFPDDLAPIPHDALGLLTLDGGDGDDRLMGGSGKTIFLAGPGADVIQPRGDDNVIIDPPDAPAIPDPAPPDTPPAEPPTPETPAPAVPAVPAPSPAPVVRPSPHTATESPLAAAVYDDNTPWLDKIEDDLFAG